jgi:hypothetical protein
MPSMKWKDLQGRIVAWQERPDSNLWSSEPMQTTMNVEPPEVQSLLHPLGWTWLPGAKLSPRCEFCPLGVKLSPGGEILFAPTFF